MCASQVTFDYCKLRGRIVEKFGSQRAFADALKTSENQVSYKLNNKKKFEDREILHWCELLGIPDRDINLYFFTKSVQNV